MTIFHLSFEVDESRMAMMKKKTILPIKIPNSSAFKEK
jgi:hypothetical protein